MHPLLLAGLALALVHFAVPLAYYLYLKRRYLHRPWDLRLDPGYQPKVTVIVPTYMGAKYIVSRLENLYLQDYPKDKIEVVVIDSASPDGTAKLVEEWAKHHPDLSVKLVIEPMRKGKLAAILEGLKHVAEDCEVIIFTDDDCLWDKHAIKNIVKYFADPLVGAVTSSIRYIGADGAVYNVYREHYNKVRIAESKWWSTPIHNGPLLAVRKSLLKSVGLPMLPGADDSAIASYIAFAGYRSIQVDDVYTYEPLARNQWKRMVRRAVHLSTYFRKLKQYAKQNGIYRKSPFDTIWRIEAYLHLINPLLLVTATTLLIAGAALGNLVAVALLLLGLALFSLKTFRTWVIHQIYLVIGLLLSLKTHYSTWNRPP